MSPAAASERRKEAASRMLFRNGKVVKALSKNKKISMGLALCFQGGFSWVI